MCEDLDLFPIKTFLVYSTYFHQWTWMTTFPWKCRRISFVTTATALSEAATTSSGTYSHIQVRAGWSLRQCLTMFFFSLGDVCCYIMTGWRQMKTSLMANGCFFCNLVFQLTLTIGNDVKHLSSMWLFSHKSKMILSQINMHFQPFEGRHLFSEYIKKSFQVILTFFIALFPPLLHFVNANWV